MFGVQISEESLMLIFSILFLLLSNAVSSSSSEPMGSYNNAISADLQDNAKRWDKSILYSRVAIIILAYTY